MEKNPEIILLVKRADELLRANLCPTCKKPQWGVVSDDTYRILDKDIFATRKESGLCVCQYSTKTNKEEQNESIYG
jgi:hypothetical protein